MTFFKFMNRVFQWPDVYIMSQTGQAKEADPQLIIKTHKRFFILAYNNLLLP